MKFIIRLDDASEKMDYVKWMRMESILDKYGVIPLVGIIPDCLDPDMEKYPLINNFWDEILPRWNDKKWTFALHGLHHIKETDKGGINPVNKKSEFAGLPLDKQKEKILSGLKILNEHNIFLKVFFAPFHTFDKNTLVAIKECSDIRIISDTIANKPYYRSGFTFVPQQAGHVRKLNIDVVTFCYHPNIMEDKDFILLEHFLMANTANCIRFPLSGCRNKKSLYDSLLSLIYFFRLRIKRKRR